MMETSSHITIIALQRLLQREASPTNDTHCQIYHLYGMVRHQIFGCGKLTGRDTGRIAQILLDQSEDYRIALQKDQFYFCHFLLNMRNTRDGFVERVGTPALSK